MMHEDFEITVKSQTDSLNWLFDNKICVMVLKIITYEITENLPLFFKIFFLLISSNDSKIKLPSLS